MNEYKVVASYDCNVSEIVILASCLKSAIVSVMSIDSIPVYASISIKRMF